MSSFLHKFFIAQSYIKGKKAGLYFSRFILRMYKSLPIILKLVIISFRVFNLFYRTFQYLLPVRFWLLVIHHFLAIYQVIFMLRLFMEYCFINPHTSNKIIKTIFNLSEPYFKLIQYYLPKNFIGAFAGIYIISLLIAFVKRLCLYHIYFYNPGMDLQEVNLLVKAVFDEKIIFN